MSRDAPLVGPQLLLHGLRAARLLPGLAVALLVALAGTAASSWSGSGTVLLYALFFGLALHHLSADPKTSPGVEFCARDVLRLGVGLLGARITVTQVAALGWHNVLVVIAAMGATMGLGFMLARRFGLARAQGFLTGGAVAICGASAALALSSVLPRRPDSDRFTLLVVMTVTLLSTVAMVLYPLAAHALALPPELAGLFLGASIHDVAQVAGAGYMMGDEAGDVAIVVKLLRVSMLVVVLGTVVTALRARPACQTPARIGAPAGPSRLALVPWFLWLFIAMVALNSAGALVPTVQQALNEASGACLVVAIGALGIKTSFRQLAGCGWRPVLLILIETLWLAALVLGYVRWGAR